MKESMWLPEAHFETIACHPQACSDGVMPIPADRSFSNEAACWPALTSALCGLEGGRACAVALGRRAQSLRSRLGTREWGNARFSEGAQAEPISLTSVISMMGPGSSTPGRLEVAPVRELMKAPRKHGELRAVVNSPGGPFLCRPLQMGADAVVEDLAPWLGIDAVAVVGKTHEALDLVCDQWGIAQEGLLLVRAGDPDGEEACENPGKARENPDGAGSTCSGRVDASLEAYIRMALSTASLRVQRSCDVALAAAHFLEMHPAVAWASYPGLLDDPSQRSAHATLSHGFGPLVSFGLVRHVSSDSSGDSDDLVARIVDRASRTRCLSCSEALASPSLELFGVPLPAPEEQDAPQDHEGICVPGIGQSALVRLDSSTLLLRAGLETALDVIGDLETCLSLALPGTQPSASV